MTDFSKLFGPRLRLFLMLKLSHQHKVLHDKLDYLVKFRTISFEKYERKTILNIRLTATLDFCFQILDFLDHRMISKVKLLSIAKCLNIQFKTAEIKKQKTLL